MDKDPYLKRLKEAGLEAEKKRLHEIEAMIKAQESKILALREDVNRVISLKRELEAKGVLLKQADIDLKRAERLLDEGIIPRERYDKAKTSYETAIASEKVAKALKDQTEESLKSHESVMAQTRASLVAGESMLKQLKATLDAQKELVKRRLVE